LTKKNSSLLEEKMFIQKVAFEFQNAVSDVLISKTISAVKKYQPKTVLISGGVSANQEIRQNLEKSLRDNFPQINYLAPEKKYTGDNATMIAVAAFFRFQKMSSSEKNGLSETWKNLEIKADLKLQNL
jgi:N6-L-threonylcarbamoyladenine synthase